MKPTTLLRTTLLLAPTLVVGSALGAVDPALPTTARPDETRADAAQADTAQAEAPRTDAALAEHEEALLELAFDTASALPLDPHVKERSREQRGVAAVALELDQPRRVRGWTASIENWRRGEVFAELAIHWAERGNREQAGHALVLAQNVLDWPEEEFKQAWRRDRIRAKVARALVLLGRFEESAQMEVDLEASERGRADVARMRLVGEDDLEPQLAAIDQTFLTGSLDQVRSALDLAVELHAGFYDDESRRKQIEALIESSEGKAPRAIFIDVYLRLARTALDAADPLHALGFLDRAEGLMVSARWLAQDLAPLQARLATLLFHAGEHERASHVLSEAFEMVEKETEERRLIGHDQAEALRPVAAAHFEIGEHERALELYRRVVENGAENSNARPRALALTATCLSMLQCGFEPPADLMKRLREVHGGLESPW